MSSNNTTSPLVFKLEHDGMSTLFTTLIILACTSPSLIRNLLAVIYPCSVLFNNRIFWVTLMVDFVWIILPVELIITAWNVQSPYFYVVTWVAIVTLVVHIIATKIHPRTQILELFLATQMDKCPCVSYIRAFTNIITGFCIFAVDFIIFPKYFYKSRLYGTALMDLGLGLYVISHAMVANEARGIFLKASVWSTFIKVCKDVIPLVFLGLARYFATSGFGYHVPVQEYGVHWNFFFTLAVIKLGSTVLFFLTPPSLHAFLGPCILATHQLLLSKAGLREFVIVGYGTHFSRNGIIEANREGIVATVGFLAIYFIGVQLGKILMAKRRTIGEWLQALAQLVIVCVSSWLLFNVASVFAERPSRKLANLAYACFIIGISSLLMVKLLLFDIVTAFFRRIATPGCQSGKTSPFEESCDRTCRLLQAINYNGLLFFVIANLVTGLFNLFADTMLYSHAEAFVIVSVYMLLLSAISLHLYNRKASLKALIWGSTRINKTSSAA